MNQIDKLTQYLISNGDVPAVKSQSVYKYAWTMGIRSLREDTLKPEQNLKKGRKGPSIEAAYEMDLEG